MALMNKYSNTLLTSRSTLQDYSPYLQEQFESAKRLIEFLQKEYNLENK
jgi:hypothetical protein